MDITKVKSLIGDKTTKHDDYLTTITPMLVTYARDYCNQSFTDDVGAETLPDTVQIFVAKAAEYNMNPTGVNSRSAPGTNYQYSMDFPPSIMRYLKPYKKVTW